MRKRIGAVLTVMAAELIGAQAVGAAGFGLQEVADGLSGAAYVGTGATASDASTIYYNPAGMTELPRPELEAGIRYFGLSATFHNDKALPQTGGTGGDAGMKPPDPALYYSRPINDRVWAGISLNSRFGLGLKYDPSWAGRYFVTKNHLTTYDVQPSVAVKVLNWLSVGGGINLDYATQGYESALNNVADGRPDGYSKLDLHAFAVGYNFGVLIKPQPGTRVGITYKSRLQYDFTGRAALTNVGPTLASLGIAGNGARLKEMMPDTATISFYQDITPKVAVLGDVGWEHWSLFKSSVVYLNSGGSIAITRNWHDTVRFGLGFQYNVTDRLRARVGASYDSSPTGISTRQPDLPIDRQIRTGISGEYDLTENLIAGLSYEYADLGAARLNIKQNDLTGTLNGHYDAYAQIIGVSLRVKF